VFQKIDYPGARFATLLISIDGAPNFVVVKNVLEVAPEFGTG
jgi:hypothetical protein